MNTVETRDLVKNLLKLADSVGFCGQVFAPSNEVEISKLCNQLRG